jgi:hypothetical protein
VPQTLNNSDLDQDADHGSIEKSEHASLIKDLVVLERQFFFERRNVKTERQRKVRELIERYISQGSEDHDS